jgi:IclR family acetate operon transcriptional repressor
MRLLEAIAERDESALGQLGETTGLQASTVHRLLATLVDCGYVVRSRQAGHYRLGHKIVLLAGAPETRVARLRAVARGHLEAIRRESDETTNLVILEGPMLVYVDQAESSRTVRMFAQIGRRVDAHATGAGKAMLAFQPEDVRAELLASPRQSFTSRTITTEAALLAELDRTRARGYGIDSEEYERGVACVGVPLLDGDGYAFAAISVSAPAARLWLLDVPGLADFMAESAREIARELGHGRQAAPEGGIGG